MKKTSLLNIILGILLLSLITIACQNQATKEIEPQQVVSVKGLAESMYYMQVYSHKLLLAVNYENLELADFYHHELEHIAEDIIDFIPEYGGQPIGELTKSMLMPILDNFEDAIDAEEINWDEIRHRARLIIRSCNACHDATGYAYIKMPEETDVNPFLQVFSPVE